MSRLGAAGLLAAALLAGCGSPPLTVDEFCELSHRLDVEIVKLVQLDPASDEFEEQLAVVRALDDQLFANPPAGIADVADELRPLLSDRGADNEEVNRLLDQVAAFVEQNCPSTDA